jgi:hypothetical protein
MIDFNIISRLITDAGAKAQLCSPYQQKPPRLTPTLGTSNYSQKRLFGRGV